MSNAPGARRLPLPYLFAALSLGLAGAVLAGLAEHTYRAHAVDFWNGTCTPQVLPSGLAPLAGGSVVLALAALLVLAAGVLAGLRKGRRTAPGLLLPAALLCLAVGVYGAGTAAGTLGRIDTMNQQMHPGTDVCTGL